jgi:general secretion pathway protein C
MQFHDNRFMQMNSQSLWWSRAVTFMVAALAAASGVYWVLQWPGAAVSPTTSVVVASATPTDPMALASLLGGASPGASTTPLVSAPSRFVLAGVVAGASHGGAALISIDGKPAKPYAVGSRVDDSLVLQSVASRRAVLAASSSGPASLTLEMKPLQK